MASKQADVFVGRRHLAQGWLDQALDARDGHADQVASGSDADQGGEVSAARRTAL